MGFASFFNDVLAGVGGAVEPDVVACAFREFDHDYRVGACGYGGSGHDLDATAGSERLGDSVASFDFADATKRCAFGGVARANGIAIAGGAIEGRIISVGVDFLS